MILFHCLIDCVVSTEKSAVTLTIVLLQILYLFSLVAFKVFLFTTVSEEFDYDMLWCSFLHFSFAWNSLKFLGLWAYSFHQIWKNFSHYFLFLPMFFLPFSPCLFFRNPNYIFRRSCELSHNALFLSFIV